jgi:hypothetical protein
MSEPTTLASRWRLAARAIALKLVGGLVSAACAPTWLPGSGPGMTARSRHGEHKAQND